MLGILNTSANARRFYLFFSKLSLWTLFWQMFSVSGVQFFLLKFFLLLSIFTGYRAVLFKWEFIIQMRDAVSQPSLDIEESYFSKNTLFFFKNDFLFYYLKLYIPSVPLIWVFEAFFGPPFCSLTKGKEEKDGSSKVGSRGKSGSVYLAAALIWMINSHLNRTALYHLLLIIYSIGNVWTTFHWITLRYGFISISNV